MCFQSEEINFARQLRDLGLSWEPQVGQYVFDETGLIETPSNIQENIHLIHDLRYLVRQAGTVRELKAAMCWLPTWREARQILRAMGLSDLKVLAALVKSDALEHGSELMVLYQLLAEQLKPAKRSDNLAPRTAGAYVADAPIEYQGRNPLRGALATTIG